MQYIKKIFAKQLRKDATEEERLVWHELRNRRYRNLKFRRQHVIEGFVVDFFCVELNLAIELDGSIHQMQKEYDEIRQAVIEEKGIRFIRITNEQIKSNMNLLFESIDRLMTDNH